MTAEQLIELLKALPPETPVMVEGYENGFDLAISLLPQPVIRYRNAQPWDGEYQEPSRFSNSEAGRIDAAVIHGRRGSRRTEGKRKSYNLAELMAQCDNSAPVPEELKAWENSPTYSASPTAARALMNLLAFATATWESAERALAWLEQAVPALGDQCPCDLLDTAEGRQQVEAVLRKIEHGDFS